MANCKIPVEIVGEILSWLPVKSILRFRCVCKSWRSLISNQDFVSLHHKRNENRYLIIRGNEYLYFYDVNADDNALNLSLLPLDAVRRVLGVCNGIVWVETFSPNQKILWNPALKKYKIIQWEKCLGYGEGTRFKDMEKYRNIYPGINAFGFGLDINDKDFIYVIIMCRRWEGLIFRAEVRMYSTSSDSWRRLDGDFRFMMTESNNCAIVRGVPYWTAIVKQADDDKVREVLLAFDVRNEGFKQVEYPEIAFNTGTRTYFVEWNDCLASLVYCPGEELNQCVVDVWVLDDKESCWSKKFTVGPILMEIERLVGCSGDGNILATDTRRNLFMFKSRNREIKYIHTDDGTERSSFFDEQIDVHSYRESLVSLNDMEQLQEEVEEMGSQGQTKQVVAFHFKFIHNQEHIMD